MCIQEMHDFSTNFAWCVPISEVFQNHGQQSAHAKRLYLKVVPERRLKHVEYYKRLVVPVGQKNGKFTIFVFSSLRCNMDDTHIGFHNNNMAITIDCGCLSMEQCPLRNPDDCLAERSMGAYFQEILLLLNQKNKMMNEIEWFLHQYCALNLFWSDKIT